jgi:hypothetical protein
MSYTTIHQNADIVSKAQIYLNTKGIDLDTAINEFILKVANGDLTESEVDKIVKPTIKKRPRSESWGILKGKVWMADDFNDTPDCFKEYIP